MVCSITNCFEINQWTKSKSLFCCSVFWFWVRKQMIRNGRKSKNERIFFHKTIRDWTLWMHINIRLLVIWHTHIENKIERCYANIWWIIYYLTCFFSSFFSVCFVRVINWLLDNHRWRNKRLPPPPNMLSFLFSLFHSMLGMMTVFTHLHDRIYKKPTCPMLKDSKHKSYFNEKWYFKSREKKRKEKTNVREKEKNQENISNSMETLSHFVYMVFNNVVFSKGCKAERGKGEINKR